jgi:hypothetical protein
MNDCKASTGVHGRLKSGSDRISRVGPEDQDGAYQPRLDVRPQSPRNLTLSRLQHRNQRVPAYLIYLVFGFCYPRMLSCGSSAAFLRRFCVFTSQRAFSVTPVISKVYMDGLKERNGTKPQRGGKGHKGGPRSSGKLRGLPSDSPDVRLSKSVSWILRHGAEQERLELRPDGYARVDDLVSMSATLGNNG